MELQLLDGIEDDSKGKLDREARYLLTQRNDIGELGKLKKKAKKNNNNPSEPKKKKKGIFKNIGKKLLKAVNVVNKINPATLLLRAGFLASMKLNLFKVAERLKWGYATPDFAKSKGMDMNKYAKVKKVVEKAEKIFYGAGGKPENLKKAILTGKGNKNHEVAGLEGLNENTPLSAMLGDIYHDEFVNGMDGFEGFGELGEPVTGAAIAAASGAIASIAAILKSIGPLFPKKDEGDKSGGDAPADSGTAPAAESGSDPEAGPQVPQPAANAGESAPLPESETTPPSDPSSAEVPEAPADPEPEPSENLPAASEEAPAPADPPTETPSEPPADLPAPAQAPEEGTNGVLSGIGTGIKAFWANRPKWLVPVGIVGLAIAGTAIYLASKKEAPEPKQRNHALNGVKPKKRKAKKGGKNKGGSKQIIALM